MTHKVKYNRSIIGSLAITPLALASQVWGISQNTNIRSHMTTLALCFSFVLFMLSAECSTTVFCETEVFSFMVILRLKKQQHMQTLATPTG